ncbi:class I SAM-dependent methyltransferase [[Mycobacterium] vasticus]|uniref:Class I SAM-dependent methyltransferase n=1 Tax=[Mycobacterium] vasticus TaxID=2875777 RepID=A0ABU5Z3T5_9MYCO|nr:class I SAM-dependent methyltransferase [Mycolicibacter sp. MYC017]MEB3072062.1 class I SAM-dependent methyltransferase [Mycolicibacter sp. MYC017]
MQTTDWNRQLWYGGYKWDAQGEEWSAAWGGSEPQWFGSLYPRLHRVLPASSILEIAPGMGRWTKFLLPLCRNYVGVDISLECVRGCQKTFADAHHARFMHKDGYSLSEVEDHSVDLVFSFDTLVHAEFDVLKRLIPQILQKLNERGVAFIHHSNMGSVGAEFKDAPDFGLRALSVSYKNIEDLIVQSGGRVIIQEVIDWGSGKVPRDCLTMLARGDGQQTDPVHLYNLQFMEESSNIRHFHAPYSVRLPDPTVPDTVSCQDAVEVDNLASQTALQRQGTPTKVLPVAADEVADERIAADVAVPRRGGMESPRSSKHRLQ